MLHQSWKWFVAWSSDLDFTTETTLCVQQKLVESTLFLVLTCGDVLYMKESAHGLGLRLISFHYELHLEVNWSCYAALPHSLLCVHLWNHWIHNYHPLRLVAQSLDWIRKCNFQVLAPNTRNKIDFQLQNLLVVNKFKTLVKDLMCKCLIWSGFHVINLFNYFYCWNCVAAILGQFSLVKEMFNLNGTHLVKYRLKKINT